MTSALAEEKNEKVVEALIRYDDAKRAYAVAKKMNNADLEKVAGAGGITSTEDRMMRAAVADAARWLARLKELIEGPG